MELRKIRQLAKLLHSEGLSELELQSGESYLRLKRAKDGVVQRVVELKSNKIEEAQQETVVVDEQECEFIPSPLAGTFYQAKSPGTPAFVSSGDTVTAGQTLCILEAMKLMNELEAPFDCKIVEILVEDADPVSEGQPLFKVVSK